MDEIKNNGRILFTYRTPFYDPIYSEFWNRVELYNFLSNLNFMKSHFPTNMTVGMPEFQLGIRTAYNIDGNLYKSDIEWGPRFLVAHNVSMASHNELISAEIPMDAYKNSEPLVQRTLRCVPLAVGEYDAVLDMHKMNKIDQIWPPARSHEKTVFAQFMAHALRCQNKLRGR